MVRLEALGQQQDMKPLWKFQFLVVRLEGNAKAVKMLSSQISIPCGAIRRFFVQGFRPCRFRISIPCGAIRRI